MALPAARRILLCLMQRFHGYPYTAVGVALVKV